MELLIVLYIFICAFFMCGYAGNEDSVSLTKSQMPFVVVSFFILLYFHCAVDLYSVEDLGAYENRYNEAAKLSFYTFNDAYRTKEYAFNYFSKFLTYISDDFRFFLVIYNIIYFYIYYSVLKKYSVNMPLSIIGMMLTVYYQSIFVIRQHLAISILLLTIPMIIRKKIIPFLLICLLSFYIHMSSIVWIPIYFLYNIRDNRMYVLFLLLTVVVIIASGYYMQDFAIFIEADYSLYIDHSSKTSLTKNLINISYLIVYMLTLNKDMFKEGINKFTTTLLILNTIGYLFAPQVELIDRLLTYYNIAIIFSIPLTWYYIKSVSLRNIFVVAIIVLQGYVSLQPLKADYFRNYDFVPLYYPYFILCLLTTYLLYRKHLKKTITQN